MKIIFKLTFKNLWYNRTRSLLSYLCVTLTVIFITIVCSMSFSVIDYLKSVSMAIDIFETIFRLSKGVIYLGIILGLFMIYSIISTRFNEKHKFLAYLTSLGASRSQKCAILFIETLTYLFCGIIFGIPIGVFCGRFFYNLGVNIISSYVAADIGKFIFTYDSVWVSIAICFFATALGSIIPIIKISKLSVLDSLNGRNKINISLKQGFISSVTERMFGRIGKLAGQNYYNYKSNYSLIAMSLSCGTIFFIASYCFFMYPIRWYEERGYSPEPMFYSLLYLAIILSAMVIFIFSICSFGCIEINIQQRKREFAMLKSIGFHNSQIFQMMGIESIFLILYILFYSFLGSLLVDYTICSFFRATEVSFLKFWFPVEVFLLFVLFDVVIGAIFAVCSILKIKKLNIIENLKNKE